MISNGYIVNESDCCIYSKVENSGCVIVCLYVDDTFIFGNNMYVVNSTKSFLSSVFDMKDMGKSDLILDLKLVENCRGYALFAVSLC